MSVSSGCDDATVPRLKYLQLQDQLLGERILFLREINALRNTVTSQSLQQQQLQNENMELQSAASGVFLRRKNNSSLDATVGSSSPTNAVPSSSSQSYPSPVVIGAPLPELASIKELSDALTAATTIDSLRELHAAELRKKDEAILELKNALKEQLEETSCEWLQTLRAKEHEKRTMENTFLQEKSRYKTEAIAAVDEELRQERGMVASLRAEAVKLRQEIIVLKKSLNEKDAECRSLRVQISNMQQDQVALSQERSAMKAALMAISSEKQLTEKRLKESRSEVEQLQTFREPQAPRGPRDRKASGGGKSVAISRANSYRSRRGDDDNPFSDDSDGKTGKGGKTFLQAPSGSAQQNRKKKSASTKALDDIVSFALDGDMARRVRKSITAASLQLQQQQQRRDTEIDDDDEL